LNYSTSAVGKGVSVDEQVFHATLKRIRWSTNREDLAAATRTTLQLLLRRPGDRQLLSELLAQVDVITSQLPARGGERQAAAIRQAAVRCVVLLQSAKRGRLTRAQNDELQTHRRHRRVMVLLAAAVATAAIYLVIFMPQLTGSARGGAEIAAAMENALKHSRLGLTRNGDITVRATHEHTIVTAERISPEDCVIAAQRIKSMGSLAINDVDVGRPNDDKLAKMCHQMNDATLSVTNTEYRKR
jgi:hypothetical protein